MNIPLKRAHQQWLDAQVAAGRFGSLEEAIEAAVARLQAEDAVDDHWAKPLVAEALASLERGEGSPWRPGEALARIKAQRA